jgi:hypothetical protein
MNFRDFFMGLKREEREAYAARCDTSVNYLTVAFFSTKNGIPRKRPGDEFLRRMVDASDGRVTLAEGLEYFGVATIDQLRASIDALDVSIENAAEKNRQDHARDCQQVA